MHPSHTIEDGNRLRVMKAAGVHHHIVPMGWILKATQRHSPRSPAP
jgi:hypothetical protein